MLRGLAVAVLLAGCAATPSASRASMAGRAIQVGDSVIVVSLEPDQFHLSEKDILGWVDRCASYLAVFYGRFPVPRVHLRIHPISGNRIGTGRAWPGQPPRIRMPLGRHSTRATIQDEWMLTHELVHMAWPVMDRKHHWIEEGLATYVEPLARCQSGFIQEADVWERFYQGMPNGLPEPDDGGLDHTPTWGRTYWGGALFCLVADMQIRQATDNAKGLRNAVRGVLAAGGSINEAWSIRGALLAGDRATGTTVLVDLYEAWANAPVDVDLDQLWADLGVKRYPGAIGFDDDAPLAHIRRAITKR